MNQNVIHLKILKLLPSVDYIAYWVHMLFKQTETFNAYQREDLKLAAGYHGTEVF